MRYQMLLILFIGFTKAECFDIDCGPRLGMPNYLCPDGITIAGHGDCIENESGNCAWEILSCPQLTGYLKPIETSICMDDCSQYFLETESGEYINNVTNLNNINTLDYYNHRYIEISGEDVWCVECSAIDVVDIAISVDCEYPVDCFQDPCIESICPAYPNAECVATFCGGCYADFYQNGELIYDCIIASNCIDLSGIDFGFCDMVLGVGFVNGECQYLSGCDWVDIEGSSWHHAFYNTFEDCEAACYEQELSCDELFSEYENLHNGEYRDCEYDIDCMAVWGHCDVGLGGCHYSVNTENYPEEEIQELVNIWIDNDCMQGVCDCAGLPYAQCINGECTSVNCMFHNPAGCQQTGCPDGYECIVNQNDCIPSYCECESAYGYGWFCTEDCGGGICVESILEGDLNYDGENNVVDVVLAVEHILSNEYNSNGDMNGDGHLNVVDLIILVNLILS